MTPIDKLRSVADTAPPASQERVASELERIAYEEPVSGNLIAQERVLMAAARIRAGQPASQEQPEHPMACWSVDVHDDDDGRTWINIRNPDDDAACLSTKTMIRRGQRSIASSVLYEFHAAWKAMHEQPVQAEAADPLRSVLLPIDVTVGHVTFLAGSNIKPLIEHARNLDADTAQAEAVEPAAPVAGPDLWWVCFEDDANTGAVWTRQPGSDDLAWLSKETGRPNVTFRLVLERAQACKPVGHWSDNPPARQCSECSITHDVGECDQPATQAPTAVPEDVRRDAERLDALSRPGWELSENSDPECMPHEQWQVHRVSGGRNDREWTLIGSGANPRTAIDAARKAGSAA